MSKTKSAYYASRFHLWWALVIISIALFNPFWMSVGVAIISSVWALSTFYVAYTNGPWMYDLKGSYRLLSIEPYKNMRVFIDRDVRVSVEDIYRTVHGAADSFVQNFGYGDHKPLKTNYYFKNYDIHTYWTLRPYLSFNGPFKVFRANLGKPFALDSLRRDVLRNMAENHFPQNTADRDIEMLSQKGLW